MDSTGKAKQPRKVKRPVPEPAPETTLEADITFIKANLDNADTLDARVEELNCKSLKMRRDAGERLAKVRDECRDPSHLYYCDWLGLLKNEGLKQQRVSEAITLYEGWEKLPPGGNFAFKEALRFIKDLKDAEKSTQQPETPTVGSGEQADYGSGMQPVAPEEATTDSVTSPAPSHDSATAATVPTNPVADGVAADWKLEKGDVYGFVPPDGKAGAQIVVEVTAVDEKAKTASIKSCDPPELTWANVAWAELGNYCPPSPTVTVPKRTADERETTSTGHGASESGADAAAKVEPKKSAKRKPNGDEDVGDDGSVDFIPTLTKEEDEEYRPLLEYLMGELQLKTVKAAVFHAIKSDCEALKGRTEGRSRG